MAEPYLGEIHMFAGRWTPRGYAECLGQLLPIRQNESLYSLLWTQYGGDGTTTFGIPDLRGRLPVHAGTGPGLSISWTQGECIGVEDVTMRRDNLPSHTHEARVSDSPASSASPSEAVFCALDENSRGSIYIPKDPSGRPPNLTSMYEDALTPTGGSEPHNNLMPYLAIRFAIAVEGGYPRRQ